MNRLLHFTNQILLKLFGRQIKLFRYHLDDGYWAFRNNYTGFETLQDRLFRLLELKNFEGVSLLQIGAHDGVDNNQVSLVALAMLPKSHLVLIEPNPDVYVKLSNNYSAYHNVTCLNIAVADSIGTRPFYTVRDDPGFPSWIDQLSTFDINQILRFKLDLPGIENLIVETDVECSTFEHVVQTRLEGKVDVVLIDVEGYDATIVKSIPLAIFKPSVVMFEHKHLCSMDLIGVIKYLAGHGYLFSHGEYDTLAYLP